MSCHTGVPGGAGAGLGAGGFGGVPGGGGGGVPGAGGEPKSILHSEHYSHLSSVALYCVYLLRTLFRYDIVN